MTYKYALAGIDMGGSKAILWVHTEDYDAEQLYPSQGRMVDEYAGRFVTGGGMGTNTCELRWVAAETDYVMGLPEQFDHPRATTLAVGASSGPWRPTVSWHMTATVPYQTST